MYVIVALVGLIAIGMFISTLTEVPIAAMAATVAVTIIVEVLDNVPQIGSLRSAMFTHNWLGFGNLLRPDVDLALTDGWSSGVGLGLGLSGARRLVDEFELTSKPGTGTSVVVVKWSR